MFTYSEIIYKQFFSVKSVSYLAMFSCFNSLRKGSFQYLPDENPNINGDSIDNRNIFKSVLSFEEVHEQINK